MNTITLTTQVGQAVSYGHSLMYNRASKATVCDVLASTMEMSSQLTSSSDDVHNWPYYFYDEVVEDQLQLSLKQLTVSISFSD